MEQKTHLFYHLIKQRNFVWPTFRDFYRPLLFIKSCIIHAHLPQNHPAWVFYVEMSQIVGRDPQESWER